MVKLKILTLSPPPPVKKYLKRTYIIRMIALITLLMLKYAGWSHWIQKPNIFRVSFVGSQIAALKHGPVDNLPLKLLF